MRRRRRCRTHRRRPPVRRRFWGLCALAPVFPACSDRGPEVTKGAVGDAGQRSTVAIGLADEFAVLTCDRRANSRSPRPAGWSTTTIEEQADDAYALVMALGLAPAVACDNSMGAMILTDLTLRHPEVVRGAIFHEPPSKSSSAGWRVTTPTTRSIRSSRLGCWPTVMLVRRRTDSGFRLPPR
ncbi:alpha/beta fold hydrolase [Amycolatopsis sp. NPDC051371]|uniref:alpha/beta fold hydrolase n=1 Tax=Amycolatopsis sp. NPDC051371 TaxID=3155800 RepID=UPI003436F1BC